MYSVILASALITTGGAAEQWHCRGGHSAGGNPWGWGTWNFCSGCFGCYGCWGGSNGGCSGCSCSGCSGCSGCYGCHGCSGCYGYACSGGWGNCNGWGCYGSSYSYGSYSPGAAYALYGNYLYCHGGMHQAEVTCAGCYGCYGGWSCYGTPLTTSYVPVAPAPDRDRAPATNPLPPATTPPVMPPSTTPPIPNKPSIKIEEAPLPRDKKTSESSSEVSKRATVVVEVPADAKVYIDGNLMRSTATPRLFHTPDLNNGETYFYDIKVEIVRDGRTITQDRRVILRPNTRVLAAFNDMDNNQPATARSNDR